ncbi:MAG: pseudouridine synthase [Candidatus Lokiarchaeota archaeon]|nr:pseudouridine synthase [Candidatus Lokiarchaeota archaeon]
MDPKRLIGLRQVKAISDYQFGKPVTDVLFENMQNIHLERSRSTDKIRYIFHNDNLMLTLRPNNGFFTLSLYSANIIIQNCVSPKMRVIVLNEISEFIERGRNVFCKHVVDLDEDLRPFDEVIVVNQNDKLLAIGKLKLPVSYVKSFTSGVAVNVRKGIYKSKI